MARISSGVARALGILRTRSYNAPSSRTRSISLSSASRTLFFAIRLISFSSATVIRFSIYHTSRPRPYTSAPYASMCSIMRMLIFPSVAAVLAGIAIFLWGGFAALMLLLLLATLETTLSFDNAVVNAKVLSRMNARWQQRFLTCGIPIAVFGTRLVLPVIIVALAAGLSPIAVVWLAIFDPVHYSEYLHAAHVSIAAFGSVFLLLVSFKYFFNDRKTVHWIVLIERWLSRSAASLPLSPFRRASPSLPSVSGSAHFSCAHSRSCSSAPKRSKHSCISNMERTMRFSASQSRCSLEFLWRCRRRLRVSSALYSSDLPTSRLGANF